MTQYVRIAKTMIHPKNMNIFRDPDLNLPKSIAAQSFWTGSSHNTWANNNIT